MQMTDRTPALEWKVHQRYSSLGAREDCYYTVEIGDFWMRVELDDSASGPEYWRWEFCDEVAFGYAPTHTAAQIAAEDFLRAQRDALGVLDRKEEL